MKKLSELISDVDFALANLQARNELLLGLTDSLSDIFNNVIDPIANKKEITEDDKSMVFYELLRDRNSIDSLLHSLKFFIEMQDEEFAKQNKELVINNWNKGEEK
ncbi:hypothetical protein [Limosilactobacillus reuteri]|uniref:hypothetical protein n=1 Tax=Limosilactobacillus reuteri TaxID=1598 RepID=UPI00128B2614|nr:hypothetical protein [Limosilactobacillus reuteri]MCC4518029.1 hypothetical protein [Limosilactobacillus reuteri]MQB60318.1 hypothetical protein [Limosilactobacillus reuteri]